MVNLFCLHFAGGNKYSYVPLEEYLDKSINLITLELPGRGKRFNEPLQTDIHNIVDDLYEQLKKNEYKPYAIFGHSMGAVLTYLLTHKIAKSDFPNPIHLFVSGCRAPKIERKPPFYNDLPKDEFVEKIRKMGGCPEEILQNDDLMALFEPSLRADFKAIETYKYQKQAPLKTPMTVFIGNKDKVTWNEAKEWQDETIHKIDIKEFEGNHFFIFDHKKEVTALLNYYIKTKTLLNNY
ncbi:alpha/beta fold hydrolase [Kordia algicida OT-1]|uniref:Thioesterase n=1 Tax=Kordia algicida OT-1 TaxID=391587 RepID=A9EDB4_9FLAO|nr:alpha/beta fold hydrolase [Kordia algicida]EDP94252.1 thioesterase [Kordia algicida OT-1]